MAYSDFSLRDLTRRLDVLVETAPDLFGHAPSVAESAVLRELLEEYLPLARVIDNEKARSEFVIAPILASVLQSFRERASLFSGTEFSVAPEQGLAGICDFFFSRSPQQWFVQAPLAIVVEANASDLNAEFGPCGAAMIAARSFNDREYTPSSTIFGAVTTGTTWQFLRLDGRTLCIDQRVYSVTELPKILGILEWMLAQGGETGRRVA